MVLPTSHVLLPMMFVELYRRYFAKSRFSFVFTFLAGIAGALPDIDIIFSMLVNSVTGGSVNFHRGPTHSFLVPFAVLFVSLVFFVFSRLSSSSKHRDRQGLVAFVVFIVGFGILTHVCLDWLGDNLVPLLACGDPAGCDSIATRSLNYLGILDGVLVLLWFILFGGVFSEVKDFFGGLSGGSRKVSGRRKKLVEFDD
jgi:hypothetical protein